jgi:uncharacterized membrane protein YczE
MVFIPIGVTIALAYSVSIIIMGNLTADSYAQLQSGLKEKENLKMIFIPYLIVIGVFAACFFLTYYVAIEKLEPLASFVIAENLGAMVTLFVADKLRNDAKKRK